VKAQEMPEVSKEEDRMTVISLRWFTFRAEYIHTTYYVSFTIVVIYMIQTLSVAAQYSESVFR